MTVSVLASGQIGSDSTTGPISGSHNPGVGVTPDFVVVFVIENGNTGASDVSTVTYGGAAAHIIFGGFDGAGEGGQTNAFYLDGADSIASGSQTVTVNLIASPSGAIKRVYCVSFSSDVGSLLFYDSGGNSGDQANPSDSKSIAVDDSVSGGACLYYGGGVAALSVANGAELAESDFSGGSQCGSLIWANTTVSNATLTMGWTAASDDVASVYIYFKEMAVGTGKINLGNVLINKIYLGSTEIKKVYLGTQLVHDKS